MSKGAPKGNEFWKLRSKHGRDKIFATPEIMWDAACEYFAYITDNPLQEQQIIKYKDDYEKVTLDKMRPFTLTGLCLYLDVNVQYFTDFEQSLQGKKDKSAKDFSLVLTRIRETIYSQKFEGASSGFFNPNIIARDLGLIDKSESNVKVKVDPYSELTDEQLRAEIERLSNK